MKNLYRVTVEMKNGRFGASTFQRASSEKDAIETARMYGMRGKKLVAELA